MAFEYLHVQLEAGLKARAQQAADALELRNLSAFVRMAIAEKVNEVLGKASNPLFNIPTKDKH